MKTKTLVILALFCAGFMACKKTSPSENTTHQKILGKWTFQQVVVNDFISGTSTVTTYPGGPSDYFDFRSDGKVYIMVWGANDTASYSIINESQLKMDSDTSDIIKLTGVELQLYNKDLLGPGADYSESTIYMHK